MNAQSRFASVVVDGVLRPPRLARHTWQCPCISGSNAQGESRALEGRRVSSISPSRVRDGDEGVAGRNYGKYSLLARGHWFANDFLSGFLVFNCLRPPCNNHAKPNWNRDHAGWKSAHSDFWSRVVRIDWQRWIRLNLLSLLWPYFPAKGMSMPLSQDRLTGMNTYRLVVCYFGSKYLSLGPSCGHTNGCIKNFH